MVSVLAVSSPAVLRVTLPASAGKRATPPFFFRAAQRGKFGNRGPFLGVVLNKTFTFGRWWVGRWPDSSDVGRPTSELSGHRPTHHRPKVKVLLRTTPKKGPRFPNFPRCAARKKKGGVALFPALAGSVTRSTAGDDTASTDTIEFSFSTLFPPFYSQMFARGSQLQASCKPTAGQLHANCTPTASPLQALGSPKLSQQCIADSALDSPRLAVGLQWACSWRAAGLQLACSWLAVGSHERTSGNKKVEIE